MNVTMLTSQLAIGAVIESLKAYNLCVKTDFGDGGVFVHHNISELNKWNE